MEPAAESEAATVASPSTELVAEIRLTRSLAVQLTLVASMGFFLFVPLFAAAYERLTGRTLAATEFGVLSPVEFVSGLVVVFGLMVAVTLAHELLHGVVMSRYGGTPAYGLGVTHVALPYAYAESMGTSYTRNQALIVLLAPLVVISVVGFALLLAFPTPWLLVPLAANAAGSVGDVWMALVLLQYPPSVRVDEPSGGVGLGIYGDRGDSRRRPAVRAVSTFLCGTLVGTAFVVGTMAVAVGWVIGTGRGALDVGLPGTGLFIVRFAVDPTGASASIGFPAVLLLGVLIGVGYTFATVVRDRKRAAP